MCLLSATWGGAKLSDVLQLVGVPYHTEITPSGGKHVEFISVDQCPVSFLTVFVR
jgi:sulfite oxidase